MHDARVVEQHRQLAELLLGHAHEMLDVSRLADVCLDEGGLGSEFLD